MFDEASSSKCSSTRRWRWPNRATSRACTRRRAAAICRNFTGIDSPYEAPEAPELRLDTTVDTPEAMAERVVRRLARRVTTQPNPPLRSREGVGSQTLFSRGFLPRTASQQEQQHDRRDDAIDPDDHAVRHVEHACDVTAGRGASAPSRMVMIQPTGSAPGLKKRARMPITAPPTMYIRSPSNMVFLLAAPDDAEGDASHVCGAASRDADRRSRGRFRP
jgi:hypothetical protein